MSWKSKNLKVFKDKNIYCENNFLCQKNDVVLYINNAGYNHWNVQKKYYTGSNSTANHYIYNNIQKIVIIAIEYLSKYNTKSRLIYDQIK